MPELSNREMIEKARTVLRPRRLAGGNTAGEVACALLSAGGIGFCAEHSAIAAMITAGESRIARIVAVWAEGGVIPPCGRCREFIHQVDAANLEGTQVILGEDRSVRLKELLPLPFNGNGGGG